MQSRPAGPLVQFVVIEKRVVLRVPDAPVVGELRNIGGAVCVVRQVVELPGGKLRVFVEREP